MHKMVVALLGALSLSAAPAMAQDEAERPQLALMGTVPIYWGEAEGLGDTLSGTAVAHWARAELERDYTLVPLDYLSADALAGQHFLLMAQPRALSPEENVALDEWVRSGGHLLLLADPWMTGESRFSIGDRRRPQDVALLSPILGHWGLELVFDEDQQAGIAAREIAGKPVPVNLAGHFRIADPESPCAPESAGLLAKCRIGEGQAILLADAAMLDIGEPWADAPEALALLSGMAFGENGDDAGKPAISE